jgi:hypothetical protein
MAAVAKTGLGVNSQAQMKQLIPKMRRTSLHRPMAVLLEIDAGRPPWGKRLPRAADLQQHPNSCSEAARRSAAAGKPQQSIGADSYTEAVAGSARLVDIGSVRSLVEAAKPAPRP